MPPKAYPVPVWPLLAASALGLVVRLLPLPHLFIDGRLRLTSGDGYYHLRRMALAAVGAMPDTDRWLHHPKGMRAHWPPLFDEVGGALGALAGAGPDDPEIATIVAIALVALLTAATFALVFAMACRRGGALAGWLAVVALALLPGHHNYTQAGKVDHHVLEPLATFAGFDALLLAAYAVEPRRRFAWAAIAGASMGVLLTSLPSSAMPLLLLAGCAMLLVTLSEASGVALASAFVAAGVLGLPFARTDRVVSHDLSLLQPMMAFAVAPALIVVAGLRRWSAAGAFAAGAAVAALPLLAWPSGRMAILGGSAFVASAGFVGLIDESLGAAQLGWSRSVRFLSPLALLAPPLAVWAWREDRVANGVLGVALAVAMTLAVTQLRFVMLAAVPLCVLAGAAGAEVARRGALGAAIVGIVALVDVASAAPFLIGPPSALASRVPVWRLLDWMRHEMPEGGDHWRTDGRPRYAVLAPWTFGHEVVVVAERATVASPFIAPGDTEALADTLRFALAVDPNDGEAIVRSREARYVLTVPVTEATLRRYARAIDAPPALAADPRSAARVLPLHNGSADAEGNPAWDFLRLVASVGDAAKLFEHVPGARVTGTASPDTPVTVRVDLDVGGVGVPWFTRTVVGPDGRFAVRVPYATDGGPDGNVRVVRAAIRVGTRIAPLVVSDAAVATGATVSLD